MPRKAKPLTKRRIENARPREKQYELSDGRGLALRVEARGGKVWQLRYAAPDGSRRRAKLGEWPVMSVTAARAKAAELRGNVDAGADPVAGRRAARRTVGELLDHYERVHLAKQKDSNTTAGYISKHLRPWDEERWARWAPGQESPQGRAAARRRERDLDRLRRQACATPVSTVEAADFRPLIEAASRGAQRKLVGILRLAFRYAEALGWRIPGTSPITVSSKKNPVGAFVLPKEQKHDRVLTNTEVHRVLDELEVAGDRKPRSRGYLAPHVVLALRLVLETGSRASEILNAHHDQLNFSDGTLTVTDHKTAHLHGAAPKVIMLSDTALNWILDGPTEGYLCATATGKPLTVDNLSRAWNNLANRLGLNVAGMERRARATLHSLRHTVVDRALEAGESIEMVAANAGHASQATTRQWYRNAPELARRRAAANRASLALRDTEAARRQGTADA